MKKVIDFFRKYLYIFLLSSVIGWLYEVYIFWWNGAGVINRGFLYGPYLPVYGCGGVMLILLLNKLIKKKLKIWKINVMPVIVFLLIGLIATVVEYIAHFVLDTYFGILLWDYSGQFMNINGRVCLDASLNFAIVGFAAIYIMIPILARIGKNFKLKTKDTLLITFLLVVIIDFLFVVIGKR